MAFLDELLGYLPPLIEGSLINLMSDSFLNRNPLSRTEQEALDWRRAMSLSMVHNYTQGQWLGNNQAIEIITKAWRDSGAFCLYLRNFGLGAKRQPLSVTEKERIQLEFGIEKPKFTSIDTKDLRLQSLLTERVATRISVIAIENPVWDLYGQHGVPKLVLNDTEWLEVAKAVVSAARLIILYIAHPSPGVLVELGILRAAKRQAETIILLNTGDNTTNISLPPLSDFPILLDWEGSESDEQKLVETAEKICSRPKIDGFVKFPEIAGREGVPEDLRQRANQLARQSFLEAVADPQAGKFEEAEDALVRCLVLSYLSDYTEGRARAFLELARVQYWGRKKTFLSRDNYQRALELYERELPYSSSAQEIFPLVVKEYEEIITES